MEIKDGFCQEDHLGGFIVAGDEATYCPALWDWFVRVLNVDSVLDVGCGMGYACKYFLDKGVRVLGVEGSEYAEQHNLIPGHFVRHDFTLSPYTPHERYALVWCCEVVEHIEEQYLPNVLETFQAGKLVAMTFAPPGQAGYHHVNCQSEKYWIEKLTGAGFRYLQGLTKEARSIEATGYNHFREKGLIFLKEGSGR